MTFDVTNPLKPTILKDPDAILDYSQDWSAWLTDSENDTILSHEIIPESVEAGAITVVSSQEALGVVTARLEGGVLNETEAVVYRITTVGGLVDDRTLYFKIRSR